MTRDELFMQTALALAEKGRGQVAPNPLVGCVIVRNNRIIGQGWHSKYGAAHAEKMALTNAGKRAQGATMYVTLEPCNHFGKTPPCAEAIINSGVARLVIAACDPNPKALCRAGISRIRRAGISVRTGVCAEQAQRQNEIYFHFQKTGLPFVALKLAVSLDSHLADSWGRSQWITGSPARRLARRLRGQYDAILVGSGTIRNDNPRLTARTRGLKDPIRVVLDPELSLSPRAHVFSEPGAVIVFTRVSTTKQSKRFPSRVEIVPVPCSGNLLDWRKLLRQLARRNITSVLIEGGAMTAGTALNANIVNKLYLFLAPLLLGRGLSLTSWLKPRRISAPLRISEWQTLSLGKDLLIEAYLTKE